MTIQFKATNVLYRNLEAIKKGKRILCNSGGSRSSKTWSIFQLLLIRALEGRKETYTIARKHRVWIVATLLHDFKEITDLYNIKVTPEINAGRADQTYDVNGTKFSFYGLDDPKRVHGQKQDIFWLNEVMEISRATFDQLEQRTTKFGILDFNPYDDTHWVFDLYPRDDCEVITSTMLDNAENLPQSILKKIFSYRPTDENIRQNTADSYNWDVYGLGKQAKLKGLVFENWDVVDDIPDQANDLGLGLDFGYSADPTSLVELYKYKNEIYINELLYETGLTNTSTHNEPNISDKLRQFGIGFREITADSAEPKSIAELQDVGWNIQGVKKGPDSIKYGIKLMKSYKLHITKKSINILGEFKKYKYPENRNGDITKSAVPVDAFNHSIDAIRYRMMYIMGNNAEARTYNHNDLGI